MSRARGGGPPEAEAVAGWVVTPNQRWWGGDTWRAAAGVMRHRVTHK
jgi:hypothetical protein